MPGVQRADARSDVALEQIAGLRMAYERPRTLPMRLSVTLAVRAATGTLWSREAL